MEVDKIGVHRTHCCIFHGCKYGDKNCPVVLAEVKQEYLCEWCSDDRIQDQKTESQVWAEINRTFITENRKLKIKQIQKQL